MIVTTVGELAKPHGMTLSAIKQHLLVLEGAKLVRSEKVGRARVCRLDALGEGWDERERKMDARPGGRERVAGRHPSGMVSDFDAVYMDLVPNERVILAYNMIIDGKLISTSLATWELHADGAGTRLVVTEQGAFLNGYVDGGSRLEGTNLLLDALGAALEKESAAV